MEELTIKIDGKEHKVKVEETANGKIKVYHDKEVYEVETEEDIGKEIFEDIQGSGITHEGKDIIIYKTSCTSYASRYIFFIKINKKCKDHEELVSF